MRNLNTSEKNSDFTKKLELTTRMQGYKNNMNTKAQNTGGGWIQAVLLMTLLNPGQYVL